VDLFEFGRLDFLWPEESNETERVTGQHNERNEQGLVNIRPQVAPPSFPILTGSLFLSQHCLNTTTNCSKGIFKNGNFIIPRHVLARKLELFLKGGQEKATIRHCAGLTSCFFTGRNSSFVAASSIDGL
jgi:hypothetical protein